MKSFHLSCLISLAVVLVFWLGVNDYNRCDAILVASNVANDWTGLVRGTRNFQVSTQNRWIYASLKTGAPLLTSQYDSPANCLQGCPTTFLGNNTGLDYIVATTGDVFFRDTNGDLWRVTNAGTGLTKYAGASLATGSNTDDQFFFLSNTPNGIFYRNVDGSLAYVNAATGASIQSISSNANFYPAAPTGRRPIVVRSSTVDFYWTEGGTDLWYSNIGGTPAKVNITTTTSSIGNSRPFVGTKYLVQTTDSTLSVNYLWLVDGADVTAPTLVSTGLYNVKADDYVITAPGNIIVFLAQASTSGDPYTLYRFQSGDSTPTQIVSSAIMDGAGLVAAGTGNAVLVRNSTSTLYSVVVSGTPAATLLDSTLSTLPIYSFWGSTSQVVVQTSTSTPNSLKFYTNAALTATIASNIKSFVVGTGGTNLVYLISSGGSLGLYRTTSGQPTTSTLLTPSSLTTTQANSISYAITSDSARVIYYQGSTSELYSVPISGCTYVGIQTQPSAPSQDVSCQGKTVTLSVVPVSGLTGAVYQWQQNTGGGYTNINGATSSSYSPTVGASSVLYQVLVGGDCGATMTSNSVSVGPTASGSINTQPSFASTVCESGTNVTLSISATNSPNTPSYMWKKDNVAIGGATSAGYSFTRTPGNSGTYTCNVTWWCNQIVSNSVPITILPTTTITTEPSNVTICSSAASATFTVAAAGFNNTYQWYRNGTLISGATSSSYSETQLLSLVYRDVTYHVVVTGSCGSATSRKAHLNVLPSTVPAITYQPLSKTVCPGTRLLFHVEATGELLSYRWFFGTTQLPETGPSLNISSANSSWAGDYYCEVRTSSCTVTPSQIVTLTVADSCKPTTTVIFTIGSQTLQSFNDTYRDIFLDGLVAILAELGITITKDDIVIVSLQSGSVIAEVGFLGPNSDAALQAFLDIWNLEQTAILPRNGLTTIKDIRAGSAKVIATTTSNNGGDGDGGSSTGAIVGGVVGGVLGCLVLVVCLTLLIILIVFLVMKGGSLKVPGKGAKKWDKQNWWEEDDL